MTLMSRVRVMETVSYNADTLSAFYLVIQIQRSSSLIFCSLAFWRLRLEWLDLLLVLLKSMNARTKQKYQNTQQVRMICQVDFDRFDQTAASLLMVCIEGAGYLGGRHISRGRAVGI